MYMYVTQHPHVYVYAYRTNAVTICIYVSMVSMRVYFVYSFFLMFCACKIIHAQYTVLYRRAPQLSKHG